MSIGVMGEMKVGGIEGVGMEEEVVVTEAVEAGMEGEEVIEEEEDDGENNYSLYACCSMAFCI